MAAIEKCAVHQGIEQLSVDDCLKIARLKLNSLEFAVENVTIKTVGDTPVGFLGDHYKVTITVRLSKRQTDSESIDLHFFVKTKPRNVSHTELVERLGAFQREYDFFTTLLVLLRKYVSGTEDAAQVAWAPNCYLANSKLIVLDDLSQQGYRLFDSRAGMDYDHCAVVFQTLARFHASSIIYEEKESQRLRKPFRFNVGFPNMFKETIWTYERGNAGRQLCEAATSSLEKLMPLLKLEPGRNERVRDCFGTLFDDGCRLVATSTESRNVVTHGDLWTNNILFRYDSAGSKPQDARLVDFQLLRYTAPAHDFMCALHLNTRRKFREIHCLDLALVYHSAVAAELAEYNLDVEAVMPWSEFKSSLEHYRWLGILFCCVYYPTILLSDKVAADITADPERFQKFMLEDQIDVVRSSFQTDDNFSERITELVEEMADYLTQK